VTRNIFAENMIVKTTGSCSGETILETYLHVGKTRGLFMVTESLALASLQRAPTRTRGKHDLLGTSKKIHHQLEFVFSTSLNSCIYIASLVVCFTVLAS
jgi:hypothetical protein